MFKEVVLASFCFALLSGCALIESLDGEVENKSIETTASVPQTESATSQPAGAETRSVREENKNLSSEYVKRIQTHLKNTGFYSGSVDGIASASTQSAIRHFQSGCATLKDLMTISDPATTRRRSAMAAKAAIAKNKLGTANAVRLIQLRLKDAGFDPGPIDGIYGVKTEGALLALNSGCVMLQPFSPVSTVVNTASANGERSATVTAKDPDGKLVKPANREAVRSLQTRLRNAGFDPGPIDGILGPRTKAAMQSYQASVAEASARLQ